MFTRVYPLVLGSTIDAIWFTHPMPPKEKMPCMRGNKSCDLRYLGQIKIIISFDMDSFGHIKDLFALPTVMKTFVWPIFSLPTQNTSWSNRMSNTEMDLTLLTKQNSSCTAYTLVQLLAYFVFTSVCFVWKILWGIVQVGWNTFQSEVLLHLCKRNVYHII